MAAGIIAELTARLDGRRLDRAELDSLVRVTHAEGLRDELLPLVALPGGRDRPAAARLKSLPDPLVPVGAVRAVVATGFRAVGLAQPAQPLPADVRDRVPVLAVTRVIITSTPPAWGIVAGSASKSSTRRALTRSWSQVDSDRKNCNRCTAGCWAPTTGSTPARQVSVLLRSRGSKSPVRYSRNPRRCASVENRSSNCAA
ncbi:hypothetical protein [Streptomyces sp. NPDC058728]|uniref:hypothetical protein n=1 Tax=Streptomyces sp. NPDC058728 TaxID=3346612 RepID=UPI0036BB5AC2